MPAFYCAQYWASFKGLKLLIIMNALYVLTGGYGSLRHGGRIRIGQSYCQSKYI